MDILQLFFGGVSLQFVKFIRRDNSLWKEWVHRQVKVKYYPPEKKDCLKLQVPPSPPQWALTKLVPINKAAAPTVLTAPPAKKL